MGYWYLFCLQLSMNQGMAPFQPQIAGVDGWPRAIHVFAVNSSGSSQRDEGGCSCKLHALFFGLCSARCVACQSLTLESHAGPPNSYGGSPQSPAKSCQVKLSQAEVDGHSCWFDYFSRDPRCSPFAAVLTALEERKARRLSWSRFWHAPRTSWKRLTRFHSLANDSFMLG